MDIDLGNGLIQVVTDPGKAWAGAVDQVKSLDAHTSKVLPDASQSSGEPLDWEKSHGLKAFINGGLI